MYLSSNYSLSPTEPTQLLNPLPISLTPIAIVNGSDSGFPRRLRPGVSPIQITATSSNPKIVILDVTSQTFQALDGAKAFILKPGTPGTSIVTLSGPAGYTLLGPTTILFQVK